MPTTQTELIFSQNPTAWIVTIIVMVAVMLLAFVACKRHNWRGLTVFLELTRILIVALCCLLLFKPEWQEVEQPPTRGTLAILLDRTGSMSTEDVILDDNSTISRTEFVDQLTEQEPWENLQERFNIEIIDFEDVFDESSNEDGSNYNRALTEAANAFPELRAVLLVGDGDSNIGKDPIESASRLGQRDVPVNTLVVGEPRHLPDLELLRLDAPSFTIVGDRTQLPVRVRNSTDQEVRTELELYVDDELAETHPIILPPYSELDDSINWEASSEGNFDLKVAIPEIAEELYLDNNQRSVAITARPQSIKVLTIETFPRWEYRFIRNALSRDPGVDVDCLLFHPDPRMGVGGGPDYISAFPDSIEDLSEYDVVILGDVPMDQDHLTEEQCVMLRDLVQDQASGLVFIPGPQGHIYTHQDGPLGEILPVVLNSDYPEGRHSSTPANFMLTETGRDSLLTMLTSNEQNNASTWRSLPGFYWWAAVEKTIGGAEVLAVHDSQANSYGRIPMIVARQASRGKVLFMASDGAWRWRKGVEDLYHYRFWGQVARWMSYQRQMAASDYLRIYYDPENPTPGDTVTIQANAFDRTGTPLEEGSVDVTLESPGDQTRSFSLKGPDNEGNGSFSGSFDTERRGAYTISATSPENGEVVEFTLNVEGNAREQLGQPTQPVMMSELSTITNGHSTSARNINQLLERIENIPQPKPRVKLIRLWSNLWVMLGIITLFAIFWVIRKLNGQF